MFLKKSKKKIKKIVILSKISIKKYFLLYKIHKKAQKNDLNKGREIYKDYLRKQAIIPIIGNK